MWGSSIEGEEKERGFISGNSFPLILRKAFSPSVVFFFLYFFVFLGDYKGVLPLRKEKAKKVKTHRKKEKHLPQCRQSRIFYPMQLFSSLEELSRSCRTLYKNHSKTYNKKAGGNSSSPASTHSF